MSITLLLSLETPCKVYAALPKVREDPGSKRLELNIGLGSEKGCGIPGLELFHNKLLLSSSKN